LYLVGDQQVSIHDDEGIHLHCIHFALETSTYMGSDQSELDLGHGWRFLGKWWRGVHRLAGIYVHPTAGRQWEKISRTEDNKIDRMNSHLFILSLGSRCFTKSQHGYTPSVEHFERQNCRHYRVGARILFIQVIWNNTNLSNDIVGRLESAEQLLSNLSDKAATSLSTTWVYPRMNTSATAS
jgi:hypothetical protein